MERDVTDGVSSPQRERGRGKRGPREPGPAPSRAALHEAALAYLARGAATADSVKKTLERRIGNWARRSVRAGRDAEGIAGDAAKARDLIAEIVGRLREVGLVNDTAFAENRARRMSGAGRSRRAISAHLAQKGVDAATVREAVPHDAGAELHAALQFARKRRIGPFAESDADAPRDRDARRDAERKSLGTLARAGFDWNVCDRVMRMNREDAEERLRERREF
ncbi:MAG: regulatory protein [Myxococcales bacterium]|nr:regulatory protein [Myxococcales bacterium]